MTTADWHVGRTLRNRSRADEHRAVLAEIAGIARAEEVDLVIVAGDLFDSTSPAAESEQIVYGALLDLTASGAEVIVIAGNHDHPRRLQAVTPILNRVQVRVAAAISRPDQGGVVKLTTRGGEAASIALVPFISKREAVRANELMALEAAGQVQKYMELCERIVAALCRDLDSASVNIAVGHLAVLGGTMGGGERLAHTVFDYYVPSQIFPATLHYVALGHLHAPQRIGAGCPMWYSGSPLQLDFGETTVTNSVLLVDARAGTPAEVTQVPLKSGRRLRTLKGTLSSMAPAAATVGDDYLKLILQESPRIGLADEARNLFANAVDVSVERSAASTQTAIANTDDGDPNELFRSYLKEQGQDDDLVIAAFDELLERHDAPSKA